MPKFVLLDNSLAPAGGHHFEFAEAILQVAERAGYEPIIGANVALAESAELGKRWPTHRVFPWNVYHEYNLFYFAWWEEREAKKKAVRLPGPLKPVSDLINDVRMRLRRRRWPEKRAVRGEGFLAGCHELFKHVSLAAGDIVMLPTVSDLELEMLGRLFREKPETVDAEWRLYFHNNFLIGRPPEYDAQSFRLATMQKSLQSCLAAGNGHKLRFYTTTQQLAEQFERLGSGARFSRLTFPAREALRKVAPETGGGPKQVVCAGGFRDERGQFALPQIVSAIWDDLLKPARVQIVVQRDKPEWQVPLPEDASACAAPAMPVVYHPHPLSTEAYNHLIQHADVGLLLHDAHSYYSRLSAVFQEYACAGIPVIVPAGCWLGDQIADENSRYCQNLLMEHKQCILAHAPVTFETAGGYLGGHGRGKFAFRGSQAALAGTWESPRGAAELIVQWKWLAPDEPGQFIRISLERLNADGQWQGLAEEVVGRRGPECELATMFHIGPDVSRARLVFENAFAANSITISEPKLSFLSARDANAEGLPIGSSGLSFATRSEIPRLLREMLKHYTHYRRRAQEKSREWCERLRPEVTLAELRAAEAGQAVKVDSRRAA